jgi:hypothetical protein
MKFFDKKLKVGLSTFFAMILIILEFGILDGYHFTVDGISGTWKSITKSLGYNFVVMSIIVFVLTVLYVIYLGYRKNWAGLIGMELIAISPFIGAICGAAGSDSLFNVFFGWGTAHLFPMLVWMGFRKSSHAVLLIIFAVIAVIYAVGWFVAYKLKKAYDAKNPW